MKWKFENIETVYTTDQSNFERSVNYSRLKLKTNDKVIIIDDTSIDGNGSVNTESVLCESAEIVESVIENKPRRKAAKMSDLSTVLDSCDSDDCEC
jgi:adenine/guanine phosphoribosyltransferase-like PRPP-binding protein